MFSLKRGKSEPKQLCGDLRFGGTFFQRFESVWFALHGAIHCSCRLQTEVDE